MKIEELLKVQGPIACVVKARFVPAAGQDRFQPAGFPEIGHVIYKAPRENDHTERVCIVDSAASMANHLESVCMAGSFETALHPDLEGLPYVVCVSDADRSGASKGDKLDLVVCTSLSEGHRLASDYFLDAHFNYKWIEPPQAAKGKKQGGGAGWRGQIFREKLREEFKIPEVTKGKKYFVYPDNWWDIFTTIFSYDPNSLVHGVLFAKEQIKISRMLSAGLEAFGAERVGSSGVKFDRLGKTTSGQPIFSIDEETAREIRATFVIDLALLRSYGRADKGLADAQKRLLLELAFWKIHRLTHQPFRFRSGCFLECQNVEVQANGTSAAELPKLNIRQAIADCRFSRGVTRVYYPAADLFKSGKDGEEQKAAHDAEEPVDDEEPDDGGE